MCECVNSAMWMSVQISWAESQSIAHAVDCQFGFVVFAYSALFALKLGNIEKPKKTDFCFEKLTNGWHEIPALESEFLKCQ